VNPPALPEPEDISPAIEGEGGDWHTFRTACEIARLCGPEGKEFCAQWMEQWNQTCKPPWSKHDLERKIDSAWDEIYGEGSKATAAERREAWLKNPTSSLKRAPLFDPKMAVETANRISTEITPVWLDERSLLSIDSTLEEYFSRIFRPAEGEKVRLFTKFRSQGRSWPNPKTDLAQISRTAWKEGVWFLNNPVDGKEYFNPRQKKDSWRSQEAVTDWRHAVLECDHEPKEVWRPIWLKILVQLPLPILSLIDSGNISIHAVVRVPCKSKEEWDRYKGEKLLSLVKIGADPRALTAIRLTRAPACWNGKGQNWQKLLYLNPEADGTPIVKL
jgi:hypothetical protein